MTKERADNDIPPAQTGRPRRAGALAPPVLQPPGPAVIALAALAAVAVVSAVVAFVTVSVLPTGLSPISAATSEWGLGSYAWCFRWFTVSLAVAGFALIPVVRAPNDRRLTASRVLLGTFAFGRSFVGWVSMDRPGAAATTHGDIHWALGVLSFGSVIALGFVGAHAFTGTSAGRGFAVVSQASGSLAALGLIVVVASTRLHALTNVFGLFERFIYLSAVLWLGALAVTTITKAARGRHRPVSTDDPLP